MHIKLKGVEICDCDAVVIEGHVEATVHSTALEIARPGTLNGTADIDVAEIHGEFVGDLTARTRLVVHGTGRVSGTIRYGKLVVAEGGELTGDVKRLEGADDRAAAPTGSAATAAIGDDRRRRAAAAVPVQRALVELTSGRPAPPDGGAARGNATGATAADAARPRVARFAGDPYRAHSHVQESRDARVVSNADDRRVPDRAHARSRRRATSTSTACAACSTA